MQPKAGTLSSQSLTHKKESHAEMLLYVRPPFKTTKNVGTFIVVGRFFLSVLQMGLSLPWVAAVAFQDCSIGETM